MSCREWKEVKLAEVCEIIGGGTPKTSVPEYWNGEIPWLSVVDFNSANRWVFTTERTITESGLNNSSTKMLNKGDIIISARGTVGALAQLAKPMVFNQSCYGIRANKESVNDFLYYSIKNITQHIKANTHGSVFDTITRNTFEILNILLPPLPEQKAIAATLSCLDEMIELNNHTNQTLEELAQVIFKYWFVDFEFPNEDGQPYKSSGGAMADSELGEIPEGWRVGRFNELVDKTMSGDWGKANPQGKFTQKVVCIRGADIPEIAKGNKGNAPYRYINTKNLANKVLGPYEMIVEISGGSPTQSTGRCALISEELINSYEVPIVCTNFCRAIKFTKPEYSYFVYENWKYKYNNGIFFQYENGTTGIKNLDFLGVLTREPIIIPADRLLTDYSKILVTFTKTICEKAAENNVLSNIRDTLLPKLMSGEIRVPVEEVG